MPTVAELAQQELSRRYSLQGRTQVAPRVQTMQNARPTVRSALSNLMRDTIDATGLEGGYRQGLLNAAGGVETAVDFLPVVGDVLGLEDASRAYGQGDMVGAGINMMGVVPIIGDVAAKGAKSALRDIGENTPTNPQTSIEQLSQDIESRYGLDSFTVYEKGDDVTLGMITVPKGKRKQGVGTAAMNDLIEYADTNNKRVKLTPDVKGNDQGTTSRKRLVDFYKRFGFVENKGRNKDFTVSEGMFRLPQALNTATELPLDSSSRMARSALRGLDMNPNQ